jgi:hypothetical protein
MPPSDDTIREIAKALRHHVDAATLEKVVNELLDVPGNRDFRNAIEELARELMRRWDRGVQRGSHETTKIRILAPCCVTELLCGRACFFSAWIMSFVPMLPLMCRMSLKDHRSFASRRSGVAGWPDQQLTGRWAAGFWN